MQERPEHGRPSGTDAPPPPVLARAATRLDAALTRLGLRSVLARDALLAVVVGAATLVLLTVLVRFGVPGGELPIEPGPARTVTVLCGLQALPLALRRVRPLTCLAGVLGGQLALVLLTAPELTVRGPAPFIAAYAVGMLVSARRAVLATALAVLLELVVAVATAAPPVAELLPTVLGALFSGLATYPLAALVGSSVSTRRRYVELLRARADDAQATRRAEVRAAVVAERARMARELHDLAAHHLSAVVVQAAAVERLVRRDPEAARAGAAWIRSQGRETLENLRLAVGVLRERPDLPGGVAGGPPHDQHTPTPGLETLEELVATARELGTPVELDRRGGTVALAPIADVALYRIVQEALSNARQHAPGAAVRIAVEVTGRVITVEVVNGPARSAPVTRPAGGSGAGLVGMAERAELVGARLVTGPVGDGGWRVRAELPLPADDRDVRRPVVPAGTEGPS